MLYSDFTLIDDGTLDTVFRCNVCGEEIRTNPDPPDDDNEEWDRVIAAGQIVLDTHNCRA